MTTKNNVKKQENEGKGCKDKFNIKLFNHEIKISDEVIDFAKFRNKVYKICFNKTNELRKRYYTLRQNVNLYDDKLLKTFKEIAYGYVGKYDEIYRDVYSMLLNEYNCEELDYNEFLENVNIISSIVNNDIMQIINEKKYNRDNMLNNMRDTFINGSVKAAVLGNSGHQLIGGISAAMSSMEIQSNLNHYLYTMNKDFIEGYDVAIEAYVKMSYDLSLYLSLISYAFVDINALKEINEKGCNFVSEAIENEKYKLILDNAKKEKYLIKMFELNLFDQVVIEEILKLNDSSNVELIKWLLFINQDNALSYLTNYDIVINCFDNDVKDLNKYFYKDVYKVISTEYNEENIFLLIYNFVSNRFFDSLDQLYSFSGNDVKKEFKYLKKKIELFETMFNNVLIKKHVIFYKKDIYEALDSFEDTQKSFYKYASFISWSFKFSFGLLVLGWSSFLFIGSITFWKVVIIVPMFFFYVYKFFKTKYWFINIAISDYRQKIKTKR